MRYRSQLNFILFIAFCFPHSANSLNLKELDHQRTQFVKAETALKNDDIKSFKLLSFELTDYPLFPYLQYEYLNYKIGSTSLQEIKTFEKRYPDFPKTHFLREAWLNVQAGEGKWKTFLAEYQPNNKASLQCRAIYARYLMDHDKTILSQGLPLWLVDYSQPNGCDALFMAMKEEGFLSTDRYWQRLTLALAKRNIPLAKHLKSQFTKAEQTQIDSWITVLENPKLIQEPKTFQNFKKASPLIHTIIVQALEQHAKQNPFGSMQLLEFAISKFNLTPDQIGTIQKAIALSLSVKRHELAQQWLDKVPLNLMDKSIYELRIRNTIKSQNWQRLLQLTDKLPPNLKKTKRWRFWRAYAFNKLGPHQNAHALFSELANQRNYYGFIASAELNKNINIHSLPKNIDSKLINKVSNSPNMMRTHELIRLNRFRESRAEWQHALKDFSEDQRQAAAQIAYQMKWYDLGILALSKAKYKHDIPIRFPLAYSDTFIKEAKRFALEPAWLFAVSRQESAFIRDAYSSAGAIGVMQLMPTTAQYVAKKISFPLNSSTELLKVDTNVRLGAAYLRYLSGKMANHPVLMTASYNAGPGRVSSWLPNKKIPAVEWIETIPVKETREYVKNVLTYIAIYRELLGEDTQIRDLMLSIPPVSA
ncbi:MAG: transglycosylase SLT domain-containing protein [Gammaproteobacteria bacterium]